MPADTLSAPAHGVDEPLVRADALAARNGTEDKQAEAQAAEEAEELAEVTGKREYVLDRWANARILELNAEEVALNHFLKQSLKYLFGLTGINPPVAARNPVSVSMHNPRFATALWAINTEAYQRKGKVGSMIVTLWPALAKWSSRWSSGTASGNNRKLAQVEWACNISASRRRSKTEHLIKGFLRRS